MKEYSSCKSAIQSCIENKSFAVAHLYNDERPMDMHIHDCYEIYYSISGGKQFLIDNRFYDIQPGDIFFINQYESHYLSQIDQAVHERIVLSIYPDTAAARFPTSSIFPKRSRTVSVILYISLRAFPALAPIWRKGPFLQSSWCS